MDSITWIGQYFRPFLRPLKTRLKPIKAISENLMKFSSKIYDFWSKFHQICMFKNAWNFLKHISYPAGRQTSKNRLKSSKTGFVDYWLCSCMTNMHIYSSFLSLFSTFKTFYSNNTIEHRFVKTRFKTMCTKRAIFLKRVPRKHFNRFTWQIWHVCMCVNKSE